MPTPRMVDGMQPPRLCRLAAAAIPGAWRRSLPQPERH